MFARSLREELAGFAGEEVGSLQVREEADAFANLADRLGRESGGDARIAGDNGHEEVAAEQFDGSTSPPTVPLGAGPPFELLRPEAQRDIAAAVRAAREVRRQCNRAPAPTKRSASP